MGMSKPVYNLPNLASWFAVQVKGTHEKRVASMLDCSGFTWFLPLYECRRYWSDRIKRVKLPLFPGYIFCRFAPSDRAPILKIPSVIRIVGIGQTPVAIGEEEIGALQTAVESGLAVTPHLFLHVGHRVRIERGPLKGLEGYFVSDLQKPDRIVISVTLLQRSVAVEIDRAWVTSADASVTAIAAPKLVIAAQPPYSAPDRATPNRNKAA